MATQAERRSATRSVLLDAAAERLVAHGMAGFTTSAVTEKAGMSNGALFGHFPTRLDLLAATLEHVLGRLRHDYETTFSDLIPTGDDDVAPDPETALALLWAAMSDEQFCAVLEIYTRSRTDVELASAIRSIVADHGRYVADLVERVATAIAVTPAVVPQLTALGNTAILAMQGLTVRLMVDSSPRVADGLIAGFADTIRTINDASSTTDDVHHDTRHDAPQRAKGPSS